MFNRRLSRSAWQARLAVASNVAVVLAYGLFAYAQLHRVVVDHVFTSAPFAINFTVIFALAVVRRRPFDTTTRFRDWALGLTAWLPLALQPTDTSRAFGLAGGSISLVGAMLTIIAVVSLGRSFGIVAANRGIRTIGAYRVLRHPLYAAEIVAIGGNLLANPGAFNASIVAITFAALPLRIAAEERVLSRSPEYREYKARVLWRLLPGVY